MSEEREGLMLRVMNPSFADPTAKAAWIDGAKAVLGDLSNLLGYDESEQELEARFVFRLGRRAVDVWISSDGGERRAEQYAAGIVSTATAAVMMANSKIEESPESLSDEAEHMHGFAIRREVLLSDFRKQEPGSNGGPFDRYPPQTQESADDGQ